MLTIPETIELGKPFQKGLTCYLEGSLFEYNSKGCFLLIAYSMMTENEIKSFYKDKVEFNLDVYENIIFFFKKIEGLRGWSHSPYNYHLVDPKIRPSLEDTGGEDELRMQMILVEARIGVVIGVREAKLSPRLSAKLVREIRKQSQDEFDKDAYY